MSKLKEKISIGKLQELSTVLGEIRTAVDKTITDCQAIDMDSTMIEGWPTLARGVQFVLDQTQKFVGSASKIHTLNAEDLLMPGQSYAPTKKPYTPRATIQVDKAAELSAVCDVTKDKKVAKRG
jgi:hypothetical protein